MRLHTAVPVLLAVVACGRGGPKVELRFHPPAGAVYHYGIQQRVEVSADSGPIAKMGRQQMVMHVFFTQTVKGRASNGPGTEVEVLFESVTMDMPGIRGGANAMGSALAGMQGIRAIMVIDELGKILRSEYVNPPHVAVDLSKRISSGVNSVMFGFPERPVGPGDSWTVTMELPLDEVPGISASNKEVARTTLTVREFRIEGSDTSVVLDLKTEFPSEPIRLASGGESGTLQLGGSLTGHQVFSLSRGAIVDGEVRGTMNMRLTGSGLGTGGVSMKMDNENAIVLLPN